jgi:predicted ATPase with chaperone activity
MDRRTDMGFLDTPDAAGAARHLAITLPATSHGETLETTRIPLVAGLTGDRTTVVTTRPFRAPHHTISDVGLIGGPGADAGRRVAGP